MPTIKKNKKKYSQKKGRNIDVARIYNSRQWQKLRNAYLMQHPLCELCEKNDIIRPTEEIHHIKPILTGNTQLEMESIAYDGNNLIALCKECHHRIHNDIKKGSRE